MVIVYTAGTWDLFHIGHLNILEKSKELGDILIVGISTDELVKKYKNEYPVVPFKERFRIIESLTCVNLVVKQEKLLDIQQMKILGINVLTIGSDWRNKYIEGLEWAGDEPDIKVVYLPYTKGISTTDIKKCIKDE